MKIYKKLIKPMMLVPTSANDYSPKKVPIEPKEKWYPEENREALAEKYKHLETTFETLIFEEKYEEVDFAMLKQQEVRELSMDEWQEWKKNPKRDPICVLWENDITPIWVLKPTDVYELAFLMGKLKLFTGKPTFEQCKEAKWK